ncbi:gp2 [Sclerotinia sclerotiorum negative-stranded RNA virus 3-A]|nr:gp2 [Sclerotinia sclerotiorum negative-stranded RNA virus 3-A]
MSDSRLSIPDVFKDKDTYGVNIEANRDRLPVIDLTRNCEYSDIFVSVTDLPVRMCLAGLQHAEDSDDIAKLIIGALISASGVNHSTARLANPFKDTATDIKNWVISRFSHVPVEDASEADLPPLSDSCIPKWYDELEVPDEAILFAYGVDSMEVAAFAGILAIAVAKQPTPENLDAFNLKLLNVISQFMPSGELKVFTDNSPYLSHAVLSKVNKTFNSIIRDRALVMSSIVDKDDPMVSGTQRMFYVMFRLTFGASLSPLLLITKYARKYPQFFKEFRDLETEYFAAAHALQRFLDTSTKRRMYLKVIFGSAYIPIDRNDINELLGVAVFALSQQESTLGQYAGGTLSVQHREKLIALLNIREVAEEAVPEAPAQ